MLRRMVPFFVIAGIVTGITAVLALQVAAQLKTVEWTSEQSEAPLADALKR
jgi:hypothetical protein